MRRCGEWLALAASVWLAGWCAAEAGQNLEVIVRAGEVEFRAGGELVTRYHAGPDVAKPYFWPVNASGGVPVTRGWPMEKSDGPHDHPSQKSLWLGHGEVIAEGTAGGKQSVRRVNFWGEDRGHIVCTEIGKPHVAPGHGWIRTRNEWRAEDGRTLLRETRVIHLYDWGTARLLVLEVEFEADAGPVVFGDTKEGTLGVRVAETIAGRRIENAEGKVGQWACWGRQAAWCDCSGERVGVALFDDPQNRPPACWHCRAYGLLAANPFGRWWSGFPAVAGRTDRVRLAKSERLRLRYGVLVHRAGAKVGEFFERFVKVRKGEMFGGESKLRPGGGE